MGSNGVASIGGINHKVAVYVDLGVLNGGANEEVVGHLREIRREGGFTLIYSAQQLADYLRLQESGIPEPHFLVAQGQTDSSLCLYAPSAEGSDLIVIEQEVSSGTIEGIVSQLGHERSIGVGGAGSALLRATAHSVTILPDSDGIAYGLVGAVNGTFSYNAKDAMEGLNQARNIAEFVRTNPRE